MDPLSVLPEEIHRNILQYLNRDDILNASLINKNWYKTIGQSRACMKKLILNFTKGNFTNSIECLLNSHRNYQHVIIGVGYIKFEKFGILEKIMRSILKKFSGSIVSIDTTHDLQRICDLPKLREVTLQNSCYGVCAGGKQFLYSNGILAKTKSIEKLTIYRCMDSRIRKQLQNFLKNMKNLKSLILLENIFTGFNFEGLEFNLKEFVYLKSCCRLSHADSALIIEFLKTQASSIQILEIPFILNENEMEFLLTKLPMLHTLHIKDTYFDGPKTISPIINQTIKTLKYANTANNGFLPYLPYLKNLQNLYVNDLNIEVFEILVYCPLVTNVKFVYVDVSFTIPIVHFIENRRNIDYEMVNRNLW